MPEEAYLLSLHTGRLDRDLLSRLVAQVTGYVGEHTDHRDGFLAELREHLTLSDEEIGDLAPPRSQRYPWTDLSLRKYQLPYLDANIAVVARFKPLRQRKLLEIRSELTMLHELIDQTREYQRMTFDDAISEHNRAAVEANLDRVYENIRSRLRNLVELGAELHTPAGP